MSPEDLTKKEPKRPEVLVGIPPRFIGSNESSFEADDTYLVKVQAVPAPTFQGGDVEMYQGNGLEPLLHAYRFLCGRLTSSL